MTIEDVRSNCTGGLRTGIDVWNMAVIPFLYNNSECWVNIPKKAINILNSIQNKFFLALFGTSKGCPIPIFYWDCGILSPMNFIILKKLSFYHYLLLLPETTLAKKILNKQKEEGLPGLAYECMEFLNELEIKSNPVISTKFNLKNYLKANYTIKIEKNYSIK